MTESQARPDGTSYRRYWALSCGCGWTASALVRAAVDDLLAAHRRDESIHAPAAPGDSRRGRQAALVMGSLEMSTAPMPEQLRKELADLLAMALVADLKKSPWSVECACGWHAVASTEEHARELADGHEVPKGQEAAHLLTVGPRLAQTRTSVEVTGTKKEREALKAAARDHATRIEVPPMTDSNPTAGRPKLPKALQVRIFRRDGWLCVGCGRPVIFPPAMWALAQLLKRKGYPGVAYFDTRWSRTKAPLLDHLAAVVDHKEPWSKVLKHEDSNLRTLCNKCNMRKSSGKLKDMRRVIHSRRGEPVAWDGFSTLFLVLAKQDRLQLSASDSDWLRALEGADAAPRR